MTNVDIGWTGLVPALLLVVVVCVVSVVRRLRLETDLLVATVRSVGQLLIAGWALTLLLNDGVSIIWAWFWVVAMVPAAAWSACRREPRLPSLFLTTIIGYSLGLATSLLVVFGLNVLPIKAQVLVPLSGMVIGNSLKVVVVAATSVVDGFRDRSGEVEALLALGFDRRRAAREVSSDALRLAVSPQIEVTRSVGIVFLPGALTGMILAGVDPLDAALVQAVILFLILGSAAITGLVVVLGAGRCFFTPDYRLVLPSQSEK
ncbi:MAG: ABC transporter permease [Acidimicrobiales bacterium]|nr:ABC transporter permease [Acidimicrobiales bacterium]